MRLEEPDVLKPLYSTLSIQQTRVNIHLVPGNVRGTGNHILRREKDHKEGFVIGAISTQQGHRRLSRLGRPRVDLKDT